LEEIENAVFENIFVTVLEAKDLIEIESGFKGEPVSFY
jgi:hypothetical protein